MDKDTSIKQSSDEELAARVVGGSRVSFEELISRYSPRLFNFLRGRVTSNQDIEDLVQETFLKAFRNIDRYNPKWKFSTWLYTAAVRLAISHYRSNKARGMSIMPKSSSLDPQEIMIQKEESQNIWIMAKTLKEKEYEALWLRYVEDMSIKEIAQVMKKNHIYIGVILHRARLNLAKKFDLSASSENIASAASVKHKYSFL